MASYYQGRVSQARFGYSIRVYQVKIDEGCFCISLAFYEERIRIQELSPPLATEFKIESEAKYMQANSSGIWVATPFALGRLSTILLAQTLRCRAVSGLRDFARFFHGLWPMVNRCSYFRPSITALVHKRRPVSLGYLGFLFR